MDNLDTVKENLEKITILLGAEGFSEETALLMLDTLKLIEMLDMGSLSIEEANWLNQKIQVIDVHIQCLKNDIITKLLDKEKELNLIDDITKNLQEIV